MTLIKLVRLARHLASRKPYMMRERYAYDRRKVNGYFNEVKDKISTSCLPDSGDQISACKDVLGKNIVAIAEDLTRVIEPQA